jgi:hypothetical protein
MSYNDFLVYTNIFDSITKIIDPLDKCYCNEGWNDINDCCCPSDPRVTGILVNICVVGNPIKTYPQNSIYNVRIYEKQTIQSECNKTDFEDEDMLSEFTMSHSLSEEYPDTYVKYAKTYLQYKNDTIVINKLMYKFKAPKPIESYKNCFQNLVSKYIHLKRMM